MDLRTIAQSGINPKTGKYLTKEERIAAFRKGMGFAAANKNVSNPRGGALARMVGNGGGGGAASGGGSGGGGNRGGDLANQMQEMPIIKELRLINKSAERLFKLRTERVRLQEKFISLQRKVEERKKKNQEEKEMESKKDSGGKNIFKKNINKTIQKVGLDLFGLLQSVITYGILDWISKPENKNQVELMVRIFTGIFKLFDFFVGFAVDRTLGGFFKLFGGSSVLERIFGFFEMAFGIFLFKGFLSRVFNPLKLIGDLKWIFKNSGKFVDLFKSLSAKNLGKAFDTLKSIFPKTLSIFKQSFGRSVKRLMLRIFGKGITKLIGPLFKQATKFLVRPLAQGAKRIPIIGGLLAVPINMFLGDPIDKAIFKAAGSTLGAIAVGALGSIIPGAGTVLGAFAGGLLGDWLGGFLYDRIVPGLKGIFSKKDQPQLNTGGVASGPETGYPVTLHGTEAVIPIKKFAEVALMPYKVVGSTIIGATMAVLKSMGPVGQTLSPLAAQLFSPYIKLFGISTETFSSGLGKVSGGDISNMFMGSASAKEFPDVPATREEMVQKNIDKAKGKTDGKKDGTTVPTGDVDTSGIEAASGSVVDKGVSIAKKFMSNLGMTKEAAAAIAGNFAHESGGFIPGIREGGPFGRSSKPWPKGTVGKGYGWAQWTNSVPGDRYDKFIQSYGGDYNKIPTNEDNFKFAVQEMRTTNKLPDSFKKMTDTAKAAVWFRKNWERAGVHHDQPRISYSKGILAKMSQGGQLKNDTGFHRRERPQVLVPQYSKAKTIKENNAKGYAAGGVHRVVPDTPSTSWAAGIPLTYVKTKEGKRAEVALPLAKRFQGFINDLQSTGYKISEFGGFRPDGPPAGNVDGKGPMYAHPYGAAVDINWTRNPAFKKAGNDFPANVGQIASKYGLGWGVKFDDAMHFSAMKREYGSGINGQEISKKSLLGSKDGDNYSPDTAASPTTTTPEKTTETKQEEKPVEFTEGTLGLIRDLYKALNPGSDATQQTISGSSSKPSPPPSSPAVSLPPPSKLPEMSKVFSMDKKLNSIVPIQSPTQIIVNAPTNMIGTAFATESLNSNSISEINNLNKL